MKRYSKTTIGAYYYEGKDAKKRFIADCCEDLQKVKKASVHQPHIWHKHFVIKPDYLTEESWDLDIMVCADKFIINECSLYIEKDRTAVKYWNMQNSNKELGNVARNITEFREFLKREVCKVII